MVRFCTSTVWDTRAGFKIEILWMLVKPSRITRWSESGIEVPSWKLTCPLKSQVWRWFSFSQGGICPSMKLDPKIGVVKSPAGWLQKILDFFPWAMGNYFTSSDPHHDMLGGGCQVRVVIENMMGRMENLRTLISGFLGLVILVRWALVTMFLSWTTQTGCRIHRTYVSLIGSGEGRHTTHLLKCVPLLSTSQTDWKQSSDVLSDIFWHSFWHIFWYILLTYLLTFFLTYLLTSFLTYLLTFFLTYLLTSFLTSFWHIFWYILLTYLLTFFLTYLLTFFLTSFWQIFWHSFWQIFWHSFWHIFWHIFPHAFWHSFWHIKTKT